jgi:hypothetical protein
MHLLTNPDACPIPWCTATGQHYGHFGRLTGPLDRDPETGQVDEAAQVRASDICDTGQPLVELICWQADGSPAGQGSKHLLTIEEARQLARALDAVATQCERIGRGAAS